MNSIYLLILVFLAFPMVRICDRNGKTRVLMCGLLYYLIDSIKNIFIIALGKCDEKKDSED